MNQNTLNILIADDDQADRYQIKQLLKQSGLICECTEVVDVEAAVKACDTGVFHCVIIDYQLIGQDGLDGISLLHSRFPEMSIIMSTAQGDEMVAIEAMKRGASDCILKKNLNANLLRKSITDAVERFQLIKTLKEKEITIDHMAHYDYLTEIPNRFHFDEALLIALESAKRHKKILCVMLLDLDRFKNINDTLGHAAGDSLLKQVSKRLRSTLRSESMLARLGGDEFVILLDKIDKIENAGLAAKRLINSLQEPFLLGDEKITITPSIGIATYPFAGKTVSELMRNADNAMYQAKNAGKNNFQFYTPEFNLKMAQHLRIEAALQAALKKEEFYLYYQPIYHLHDSSLFGVEALLRWKHDEFGKIPIEEIISVAKESDLIVPIGDRVIDEAFSQYTAWRLRDKVSVKLVLNVTPQQLTFPDCLSKIERLIKTHQIDPQSLIFELPWADVVKNTLNTKKILPAVKKTGVQIFIDDFDASYSSLNMIKNLAITGITVDKNIVKNITDTESDSQKLFESLFLFAEKMGLAVVAKGVETKAQLNFLKSYTKGKTQVQGYYLSKPLPPDEVTKLLRN